jgi:hypothetical protein
MSVVRIHKGRRREANMWRQIALATAMVVASVAPVSVSAAASDAGAAPHHKTYFAQADDTSRATIRPRALYASVDGAFGARKMSWSRWRSTRAVGRGRSFEEVCKPSCARGHYVHDPVRVTLWKPKKYCGKWYFYRATFYWPHKKPRGPRHDRVRLDPTGPCFGP